MNEHAYRRMFYLASLWNIGGTIVLIVLTPWIFRVDGIERPAPGTYYWAWLGFCLVFGWGYFLVARDMAHNAGIVRLGIAGKSTFVGVFSFYYLTAPGQVPRFFWIPVLGDVWFIIRFAMYLRAAARAG
jgi:hypothetical protein